MHSKADLRRLRDAVREAVEPHLAAIAQCRPAGCIVAGGTARALGRLIIKETKGKRPKLAGLRVKPKTLERLGRGLAQLPLATRSESSRSKSSS